MFEDLKRDVGAGPPTREAWNQFLDRVESLVISPGPGLLMRRAKSGTTLWANGKRGYGTAGDETSTILPHRFFKQDDAWKVEFTSAQLWEHSLNFGGKPHEIKCGEGLLTDDSEESPRPALAVPSGTSDVWLIWRIEETCEVEDDSPEVLIGGDPEQDPFWPRRPGVGSGEETGSFGQTGNYRQKLGTITLEEGKRPVWKSESPHAVVWIDQTEWEDANPDDGQSFYHIYEEGVDKFKTIKNADTDVEEGAEGVLNDEAFPFSEHVVLARICQRESDPQIKVKSEGEDEGRKIIIEGNNVNLSLSGLIKNIQVNDGLVVAAEAATAGTGWWGFLEFNHVDGNDASNENHLKITFEGGALVKVEYKGSSGAYTDIPGTEGTPGNSTFTSYNTDTA